MQSLPDISKDLQYIKEYYNIYHKFGEIYSRGNMGSSFIALRFSTMLLDATNLTMDTFNNDNPTSPITVSILIECVYKNSHWHDVVYPDE